jgi:hypothetical protein
MTLLTPTPEVQTYATAAVAVLSVSCAALAGHLHRLLGGGAGSFLPLYSGLMVAVTVGALLVLHLPTITEQDWTAAALTAPVGLAAAGVAIAGEAFVRRRTVGSRRAAIRRPWTHAPGRAANPASLVRPDRAGGDSRTTLMLLLAAVAALEELLFRGVVVDLARAIPWTPVAIAALLASLVAFAASHVALGWAEMLAKLPLGAAALGAVLLLGSVAPAIVAHVLFNLRAWAAAAPAPRRPDTPAARATAGLRPWA